MYEVINIPDPRSRFLNDPESLERRTVIKSIKNIKKFFTKPYKFKFNYPVKDFGFEVEYYDTISKEYRMYRDGEKHIDFIVNGQRFRLGVFIYGDKYIPVVMHHKKNKGLFNRIDKIKMLEIFFDAGMTSKKENQDVLDRISKKKITETIRGRKDDADKEDEIRLYIDMNDVMLILPGMSYIGYSAVKIKDIYKYEIQDNLDKKDYVDMFKNAMFNMKYIKKLGLANETFPDNNIGDIYSHLNSSIITGIEKMYFKY